MNIVLVPQLLDQKFEERLDIAKSALLIIALRLAREFLRLLPRQLRLLLGEVFQRNQLQVRRLDWLLIDHAHELNLTRIVLASEHAALAQSTLRCWLGRTDRFAFSLGLNLVGLLQLHLEAEADLVELGRLLRRELLDSFLPVMAFVKECHVLAAERAEHLLATHQLH